MSRRGKKEKITVGFVSLGCPKNTVDSEKMLAYIAEAGFLITGDISAADVVVINTCGFIAPAKAEAMDVIREALGWKSGGQVKKVLVAGCLAERMGEELFIEAGDIDAIIGLGQRDNIADIIAASLKGDESFSHLEHVCRPISDDRGRLLITGTHSAYLRISEGCDHKCSFCTIPAIRGKFRSKPMDMVLAEAAELAAAGVVELNIIAQDTAFYGRDLKINNGLVELLKEMEKIQGPRWIRLMYLYPRGITDELIELIAASDKILPYFDMPIQHVSDKILRLMGRSDTRKSICDLIERLRERLGDIAIRTTMIVGFPGEGAEEFKELLDFVDSYSIDALGAFQYYAEQGTPAAKMPDQVAGEVKQARLDELMLRQQAIAFARNDQRVGEKHLCLIDSVEQDGRARGRYFGQAPEIDSVCLIENSSARGGEFVEVEIAGRDGYDLVCRQI
jgi:ribosomal protein S12 methylthiotransferase